MVVLFPIPSVYHVPQSVEREMRKIGVGGKLRICCCFVAMLRLTLL